MMQNRNMQWMLVTSTGLWPFADEDENDRETMMSMTVAQHARGTCTIDGATFPCVEYDDGRKFVLVATEDEGDRIMHELPPAPLTGNRDLDKEARAIHGELVPKHEYWQWIEKKENEP